MQNLFRQKPIDQLDVYDMMDTCELWKGFFGIFWAWKFAYCEIVWVGWYMRGLWDLHILKYSGGPLIWWHFKIIFNALLGFQTHSNPINIYNYSSTKLLNY